MARLNHLGNVLEIEAVYDLRRVYNRALHNQKLRPGDQGRLCRIIEAYDEHMSAIVPTDSMVQASLAEMSTLLERFEPYACVWDYIEHLERERDAAVAKQTDANARAAKAEMENERLRMRTPHEYTIDPDNVKIRYATGEPGWSRTDIMTQNGWRPVKGVSIEHIEEPRPPLNRYPRLVKDDSVYITGRVVEWESGKMLRPPDRKPKNDQLIEDVANIDEQLVSDDKK